MHLFTLSCGGYNDVTYLTAVNILTAHLKLVLLIKHLHLT